MICLQWRGITQLSNIKKGEKKCIVIQHSSLTMLLIYTTAQYIVCLIIIKLENILGHEKHCGMNKVPA